MTADPCDSGGRDTASRALYHLHRRDRPRRPKPTAEGEGLFVEPEPTPKAFVPVEGWPEDSDFRR